MKKNKTQSFELGELLNLIPLGKSKAISKKELCFLLNSNDRAVRQGVEYLRKNLLEPIAANTKNGGYYVVSTKEEAEDYLRMENNRMITIINNTKNLQKVLERKFGSMQLELPLGEK